MDHAAPAAYIFPMSAPDTLVAAEAEARLPDLLDCVERGERITITRHGRAVARLIPPVSGGTYDARRSRSSDAFPTASAPASRQDASAAQAALEGLFRLREKLSAEGVEPCSVEDILSAIREGWKH